jgi:hypothetical protein
MVAGFLGIQAPLIGAGLAGIGPNPPLPGGQAQEGVMIPAALVLLPLLVVDSIVAAMLGVFLYHHRIRRTQPHS